MKRISSVDLTNKNLDTRHTSRNAMPSFQKKRGGKIETFLRRKVRSNSSAITLLNCSLVFFWTEMHSNRQDQWPSDSCCLQSSVFLFTFCTNLWRTSSFGRLRPWWARNFWNDEKPGKLCRQQKKHKHQGKDNCWDSEQVRCDQLGTLTGQLHAH